MLISETEYRLQVEEDIKPFRDVLMGLFFVTIGVKLDLHILVGLWWQVLLGSARPVADQVAGRRPALVAAGGVARQCHPLSFVALRRWRIRLRLLGEIARLPKDVEQVALTVLVLSMLLAPFIVQYSERIVMRFVASEWLMRSMQLTQDRRPVDGHRKTRHPLRLRPQRAVSGALPGQEDINYMALDLDPDRVREAAAGGETVVFGDADARRR
jgi:CPA2 family monovalent cation:H+ antiporter-2